MYYNLYAELNLVCLLIVGGHIFEVLRGHDGSPRVRTFFHLLLAIAVACAGETIYGFAFTAGSPLWVFKATNYIYHFGINAVSYFWLVYLERRRGNGLMETKLGLLLFAVPMIASDIILLMGQIFTYNEAGYHRVPMAFVQFFLCFVPTLISSFGILIKSFSKKCYFRKEEYRILSLLSLSMVALAAVQFAVEGLESTICIGATITIIFVYEGYQAKLISSDPLTELNNRNSLDKFLQQKIGGAESRIFLVLIDIDDFKTLNDTYGHIEGDKALIMLSDVLRRSVPPKFIIARYGGDEFVLAGCADSDDEVCAAIENIRIVLNWTNETNGEKWNVNVSIGYAEYGGDVTSIPELISAADEKMYNEKLKVHV